MLKEADLYNKDSWNESQARFSRKDSFPWFDVFINCSGKSGSLTLTKSFSELGYSTVHVHGSNGFHECVFNSESMKSMTICNYMELSAKKLNEVWVFDSVREPISRKISAFFEFIDTYEMYKDVNKHLGIDLTWEESINYYDRHIEDFIRIFNHNYLVHMERYYSFSEWNQIGVDVFNHELLDGSSKRIVIEKANIHFVVLRFEDIKEWQKLIRDLGFKSFKLVSDNMADEKQYSSLYKKFLTKYTISKDMLRYIYNIEYTSVLEKFYSPDMVYKFYNSWKVNSDECQWLLLPHDFDGEKYVNKHADLYAEFGRYDGYIRDKEAWGCFHYIHHGRNEKREY